MSRATRRRAEREAKKNGGNPQTIRLENPVTQHFESFIFGNSLVCEDVVLPDTRVGKSVVICGAGPSLADEAEEHCRGADEIWGANSALTWLLDHGYPVTHGVTVDQTPAMVNEWMSAPDVEYLVASTIHPHLAEHLMSKGRHLTWFHNFVGLKKPPVEWCLCGHDHDIEHVDGMDRRKTTCVDEDCECEEYRPRVMSYEDWLYVTLYPGSVRVGSGLNTVTRAIDLALIMGFGDIKVLGADCALRVKRPLPKSVTVGSDAHRAWLQNETIMHADGGNALASGATAVTIGGEIDGRWWETKPDMAISAMYLLRMQQSFPDRLTLVGDTLPNALRGQSEDFLAMMPAMMDHHGNPIRVEPVNPILTPDAVAM